MNVFACDWVSKWSVDGMTLIVLHRFHAAELFSGEHAVYIYIYTHIYFIYTYTHYYKRICVRVYVREGEEEEERENKGD